ncbi:MAG: hypothetical protein AAGD00_01935 [Planctomycetota bacterium]
MRHALIGICSLALLTSCTSVTAPFTSDWAIEYEPTPMVRYAQVHPDDTRLFEVPFDRLGNTEARRRDGWEVMGTSRVVREESPRATPPVESSLRAEPDAQLRYHAAKVGAQRVVWARRVIGQTTRLREQVSLARSEPVPTKGGTQLRDRDTASQPVPQTRERVEYLAVYYRRRFGTDG